MIQWLRLHTLTAEGLRFNPWAGNKIPHVMCYGQKKKKKPKTVLWLLEYIWISVTACKFSSVKLFKKKKVL